MTNEQIEAKLEELRGYLRQHRYKADPSYRLPSDDEVQLQRYADALRKKHGVAP